MRPRTVVGLLVLAVVLGGLLVAGLAPTGGDLVELWVSDTPRDNQVNHHAVGVGPSGDVVVAPVAEVPHSDVELTDTSCSLVRLGPESGGVAWRAGMPAGDCFTHALTQPAIADVDGDGDLEVLVATTQDALVAYDAESGAEAWRVSLSTYGYGRPTVGNVTPAPGLEVVVSDIQGEVVVATGEGDVAWRLDLDRTAWDDPIVWARPIVADVDGDGSPEVAVGSNDGTVVLSADGGVQWQVDGSAAYLAAGDVDGDDAVELIAAGSSGVAAYDGADGAEAWSRSLSNARVRTVADGDGDGTAEVYVGRVGGEVLALDATTGETEWSTTVGDDDSIVPAPVVADVDGDGTEEVVAATEGGTVVVLAPDSGAELARYERSVPIWTFVTPADLDDDGDAEILVRYGDGRVVALDFEG